MRPAAILDAVGFNPYRKFKAKPSDYLMVGTSLLIAAGLLVWAFFG